MMESIEKLRYYAKTICCIDGDVISRFADEIEREIAEKYMKLPVDADGVPIRVGDTVIDYKTERIVVAITENAIVMDGYTDGDSIRIGYAVNHSHVKPRTIEDVLKDYWREACELPIDMPDETTAEAIDRLVVKYRAELRDLMGVDA